MSLSKYESEVKIIPQTQAVVYSRFSDLKRYSSHVSSGKGEYKMHLHQSTFVSSIGPSSVIATVCS